MNKAQLLLIVSALFVSGLAFSQVSSYEEDYGLAKLALDDGDFANAANQFKSLLERDPANRKAAYVAYFYGVAAYEQGNLDTAKDLFLQVTKQYKDFQQLNEAQLWLCKIYFEQGNPFQALYYANLTTDGKALESDIAAMKQTYYSQLDLITLESILQQDSTDVTAAWYIATWLVKFNTEKDRSQQLEELLIRYELDSAKLGLLPPADIFKEQYTIGIMLPLFTERLWHSGVYMQKSLAVDIYEGIIMALEEFDSTRIKVKVLDTKRDSVITSNIIQSGQLKDVDAIIGPLYPDPLALVSAYAKQEKVNYLNPVTTNSDLIKNNPYAFLLRSGAESIGRIISDYARTTLDTGAFAVYYGPRKTDSLTAFNYSAQMEVDSFYLSIRQRTQTDRAREIFDSLTSSVQVVDSVKLRLMIKDGESVRFMPLMDSLLLKVDSLGHIFIASDNKAIASEVMAAIASRGDSTQLIGVGNWFSMPNAGLDMMESLGVWLAMQEFENMLSEENLEISVKYRAKYSSKPGKYVYYGYYAMKFLGNSLINYGVYFQNGYKHKGNLNPLFDYRKSQDNQRLKLYRLEKGTPILLNHGQF